MGTDVAPSLVMKSIWTVLAVLLFAMGMAYVLIDHPRSLPEAPLEAEVVVLHPLAVAIPASESSTVTESAVVLETSEAVEEPRQPAQPLEERGDAMLFESEALFGTPFDQAVVMPFQ